MPFLILGFAQFSKSTSVEVSRTIAFLDWHLPSMIAREIVSDALQDFSIPIIKLRFEEIPRKTTVKGSRTTRSDVIYLLGCLTVLNSLFVIFLWQGQNFGIQGITFPLDALSQDRDMTAGSKEMIKAATPSLLQHTYLQWIFYLALLSINVCDSWWSARDTLVLNFLIDRRHAVDAISPLSVCPTKYFGAWDFDGNLTKCTSGDKLCSQSSISLSSKTSGSSSGYLRQATAQCLHSSVSCRDDTFRWSWTLIIELCVSGHSSWSTESFLWRLQSVLAYCNILYGSHNFSRERSWMSSIS